ncbi:hypothetical protein AMTRI_Chr02g253850 [Amborella trichopoda]
MGRKYNDIALDISSLSLTPFSWPPGSSPSLRTREEARNTATQQQLTIFYNGRVSVCHVTEGQASAILGLAAEEEEDVDTTLRISPVESSSDQSSSSSIISIPPLLQPHIGFSAVAKMATGQSMKRSLQRFLQKRKKLHTNSPYYR